LPHIDKPPLDDVKVRQALIHAVDFQTISEAVLRGMWYPLDSMIPPGFPGYDGKNHWLEYDPEKARQLIAESSYGSVENMPEIRLVASELGGTAGVSHITSIALAMQQYWKKNLGLEVIMTGSGPEYQENSDLYQIRRSATAARYAGLSAAICDNVNPSSTYMARWEGSIGDPLSDEQCLQADILPLEEAIPIYQEMNDRFLQEGYMIGGFRQYDYLAIKPWVSHWGRRMGGLSFGVYDAEKIFIADH
jgi:oligopeptide transport system substrate-binding protein